VPGALPFVIVSAILVLTAVSFILMNGSDNWLLGDAGSNTPADSSGDDNSRGPNNSETATMPAVVGDGEGKKALGPPGKTI
jgi:hypothetical protein